MITSKEVELIKNRLKIFHTYEDVHLKQLLEQAYASIVIQCGYFDIQESEQGAELVFERVRYAYNDALEYFDENFETMITQFSLENKVYNDEVQA